jgi:hypothetical protein
MITCPFCQKPVHRSQDERDTNTNLSEGDLTSDFYCPTYVDVAPGRRWCHYDRKTLPTGYIRYEVVIPPFDFIWYPGIKLVKIEQFKFILDPEDCETQQIYHDHATTLEEFVHICNRFKNLRVFS